MRAASFLVSFCGRVCDLVEGLAFSGVLDTDLSMVPLVFLGSGAATGFCFFSAIGCFLIGSIFCSFIGDIGFAGLSLTFATATSTCITLLGLAFTGLFFSGVTTFGFLVDVLRSERPLRSSSCISTSGYSTLADDFRTDAFLSCRADFDGDVGLSFVSSGWAYAKKLLKRRTSF